MQKIIAELNFGFWTKLLLDNHLNYRDMWRQIFINVFPYMEMSKSIDNEKKLIAMKLDNIRMFRNRIFHYEPIFNRNDLDNIHNDILNIIGWINPELLTLTKIFDEYDKIKDEENKIIEKLSHFGEKI